MGLIYDLFSFQDPFSLYSVASTLQACTISKRVYEVSYRGMYAHKDLQGHMNSASFFLAVESSNMILFSCNSIAELILLDVENSYAPLKCDSSGSQEPMRH